MAFRGYKIVDGSQEHVLAGLLFCTMTTVNAYFNDAEVL